MAKLRARLFTALSLVSLVVLAITAIAPDWIEVIFKVEPDGGNGATEALVAGALVLLTLVFGAGAVVSWRTVLARRRHLSVSDD